MTEQTLPPIIDEGGRFYRTVAARIGRHRLTLTQGEIAFTARLEAIHSFERFGPTVPVYGDLVYKTAWLITQNRLMEKPSDG